MTDLSTDKDTFAHADESVRWGPLPLDRLGLITLLTSLYFAQVWGLILVTDTHEPSLYSAVWGLTIERSVLTPELCTALLAISIVGILLPRLWQVLLLNVSVFTVAYVTASPVASNNMTTAFFFGLIVLGALAVAPDRSRDGRFEAIASVGRWLLPVMYFYGIYHKINVDFLDPAVSCAVILYDALFEGTWLHGWSFGHWSAIYATFVIEGVAMIALFIPRLKYYGMMIGIPFHVIIGFTGYQYYKDFSTIVLVLYALFLPKEAFATGLQLMTRWLGNKARALWLGRGAVFALVLVYLAASNAFFDPVGALPEDKFFMPFFGAYALAFFAFAMVCLPAGGGDAPDRAPAWLYALPVLFFVNGFSPYVGLKTESSIAMFSNLHTEGGETNHLVHGVLPGGWMYQSELVEPVGSNWAHFNSRIVARDLQLPRWELDRILAAIPGLTVWVNTSEGETSTAEGWENTYLSANPVAQKFLIFKPVDFARPKVCTH